MVILGGAGSQAGVVLGAVLVSVAARAAPRRRATRASLFYVVILARRSSPSFRLVAQARRRRSAGRRVRARRRTRSRARSTTRGSTAATARAAASPTPSRLGDRPRPTSAAWVAPVSYVALIAARARADAAPAAGCASSLLVPTLYLAAFVWENVMLAKPEPTRYILLGAILDRADDRCGRRACSARSAWRSSDGRRAARAAAASRRRSAASR